MTIIGNTLILTTGDDMLENVIVINKFDNFKKQNKDILT
jgi:hypothetical protein